MVDADEVARLVAAENARLVDTLGGLDEAGWHAPSPTIDAQDVVRPLGLTHEVDPRAAAIVLEQLTGPRFTYLSEATRAGLHWAATDADWRHGEGPEVRGSGTALVTVLGGRAVALDELDGPGVGELRRRLGA